MRTQIYTHLHSTSNTNSATLLTFSCQIQGSDEGIIETSNGRCLINLVGNTEGNTMRPYNKIHANTGFGTKTKSLDSCTKSTTRAYMVNLEILDQEHEIWGLSECCIDIYSGCKIHHLLSGAFPILPCVGPSASPILVRARFRSIATYIVWTKAKPIVWVKSNFNRLSTILLSSPIAFRKYISSVPLWAWSSQ
jgi:hypothetical protein